MSNRRPSSDVPRIRPAAGVWRSTALGCVLLGLPALRALPAEEQPAERPPTSQFGLPTGDGVFLWRHTGLQPPRDQAGVRWLLETVGQRRFQGRTVDVVAYVARDDAGQRVAARGYGQMDYVDPTTGQVVGGLDGWGHERYPDEPEPERTTHCDGR